MTYTPKQCRFGFFTDTHISRRRAFRTDDYYASVLDKMRQCYEHFKEAGCEFVIHGGDMFDRYLSRSGQSLAATLEILLDVRDLIINSGLDTYYIWGQHDLMGYNRGTARGSSLNFLREICEGHLKEVEDSVDLAGCKLFACHVDQDPKIRLLDSPRGIFKPVVAVVHALLSPEREMFDTIDIASIGRVSPVLVLSGDLHKGFAPAVSNGTTYYNPGALARTEKTDRKPKAAVITLEPLLGNWEIHIDEFFPTCEESPFPEEGEEVAEVDREIDSDEYLKSFEKFRSESKDIYERLEKVGKEKNIEKGVIDYITSKRG